MTKITQTPYLEAFKTQENLASEEDIIDFAKENLQWDYGRVQLQDVAYQPKGWMGRKLAAVPKALWCATVKTLYHFARGFFKGVLFKGAFKGNWRYWKAQRCCIKKDFLEAWGRLCTLGDDKKGLFIIQKTKFHSECYSCIANATPTREIKLSKLSKEEIENMFPSMIAHRERTRISLMSNEKIELKVKNQKKFSYLNNQELQTALEQGKLDNVYLLSLLSEEQLGSIKLSKLKQKTFECLFDSFHRYWSNDIEKKEDAKRFACFSPDEVHKAIEAGSLNSRYFELLSDEQLKEIKISHLNKEMIKELFPSADTINKKRFANIQPIEVQKALEKEVDLIDFYNIPLLSDEHWENISLSKLSKEKISKLFFHKGIKRKQEMGKLRIEEIQVLLKEVKLEYWLMPLLSNKQLQSVDISSLSQEAIDAMFPNPSIEKPRKLNPSAFDDYLRVDFTYIKMQNRELYNRLTDEQKESLKGRLPSFDHQHTDSTQSDQQPKPSQFDPFNFFGSFFGAPTSNFGATASYFEGFFNATAGFDQSGPKKNFFTDFMRNFESMFGNDDGRRQNYFSSHGASFFDLPKEEEGCREKNLKILGLEGNPTEQEIRKAYKKKALEYHPDRIKRKSEETEEEFQNRITRANEEFAKISEALNGLIADKE